MKDIEALVIGGGPVGLFAAVSLLQRGISVEVFDSAGERAVRGYACGLHPGTLRAFDQVGLMPAILELGHRIDRLVIHRGAARIGSAELNAIEGKYPYALTLRQFDLEDILVQALQRHNLSVQRHHDIHQLYARHGFVSVTGSANPGGVGTAESPAGSLVSELVERRVGYVIGADGYFSTCRRVLGVDLTTVRPTRAFAVCEFLADLRGWEREAHFDFSSEGVCAFWPLGPTLGRFTCQLYKGLDEEASLEGLRELLRERAPWFTPNPEQLCWGAVAPFEHRVVRRFGQGRVWLAGDAAHSTSPVGFQSMNRGFCEVERLSELVASALFDEDHRPSVFQDFEREQQSEWLRLFGIRPEEAQAVSSENELAPCIPASGEDFEALAAQLRASLARPHA